jgi:hypothetical protein
LPPDPVIFTDRDLGAGYLPTELRAAGLRIVTHDEHFAKRQDVLDPEVIAEVAKQGWILLTGDSDMPRRWSQEIREARLGMFCQTNNHQGPRLWVPRILSVRPSMFRAIKNWERPFVGFITAETKPKIAKAKFI